MFIEFGNECAIPQALRSERLTSAWLAASFILLALANAAQAQDNQDVKDAATSNCVKCHKEIEWIRDPESEMMQEILSLGRAASDPAGCVVCHGGDPKATEADAAHAGPKFFADPGSPWINDSTCGKCHQRHTATQWNSLMMTESGKIQGVCWGFGALEGYEHNWGNYDAENPKDPSVRIGTQAYRDYMQVKKELAPGVYVDRQTTVPEAINDPEVLRDKPGQAAFTYIRSECQRCHLAVRGRRGVRGDYRGMGCSACHIPYADAGLYEGADPTIPKDEPGHLLVHTIQATREAKVTVGKTTYSGIPLKTCETCHNRGKRIGVSFQGLMESAFESPFQDDGEGQIKLHGKTYIAMHGDVHGRKGMLCQDCHTSIDVHGDGFIAGTNLGQIQIECQDCHGTTREFPWELPLGYADESKESMTLGEPRGVANQILTSAKQGTIYPAEDGYLLTTRGNPMPDVVRHGNKVVVHTAAGKDIEMTPLKEQFATQQMENFLEASVAMHQVNKHMDGMECYACHGTWMPQCYGCHIKIDYREGIESFDWVAAGHQHKAPENRSDNVETDYPGKVRGKVSEQRSYLRWEDPPLAVNGEGRICPVTTGCQTTVTILDAQGKTIVKNHNFRSPANTEGGGPEGQLTVDMSPGQPHTMGRSRTCASCHNNPKALGYGIGSGKLTGPWDRAVHVDLMTAEGAPIPASAVPQMEPIAGLTADWSRFVTEDGKQLMTVGHHWPLSRPLDNRERTNADREGVCLACHQEIPTESLAVSFLHHIAQRMDAIPKNDQEHSDLINKNILLAAWVQLAGITLGPLFALSIAWIGWRRFRKRQQASN